MVYPSLFLYFFAGWFLHYTLVLIVLNTEVSQTSSFLATWHTCTWRLYSSARRITAAMVCPSACTQMGRLRGQLWKCWRKGIQTWAWHTHAWVCTHTRTHARTCTHTHAHARTYTCTHTHTRAHTDTHAHNLHMLCSIWQIDKNEKAEGSSSRIVMTYTNDNLYTLCHLLFTLILIHSHNNIH